jgi:RNA polymerase-binding transcription factor DksA
MLKTQLLLKQAELEARLERTHKHIHNKEEPVSADFAEQIKQTENDQVIYALEQEALAELVQVKRALQRLDEGNYSKCSRCGLPITQSRLTALPTTEICFDCASKA